jgi:hypothetical protein
MEYSKVKYVRFDMRFFFSTIFFNKRIYSYIYAVRSGCNGYNTNKRGNRLTMSYFNNFDNEFKKILKMEKKL